MARDLAVLRIWSAVREGGLGSGAAAEGQEAGASEAAVVGRREQAVGCVVGRDPLDMAVGAAGVAPV